LLHPAGSSPCGLTQPMSLHCTHPLCSLGFPRVHRYYRGVPSLGAAFVLSPSWFMPLVVSPFPSAPKVPLFRIIASPELKPPICRIPFRP
jgi:hypothetical protein